MNHLAMRQGKAINYIPIKDNSFSQEKRKELRASEGIQTMQ